MPRRNRFCLYVLALLKGGTSMVSYIGAQAFFLSLSEPIYSLSVTVAMGVLFSGFVKVVRIERLKFSAFAVVVNLVIMGMLLLAMSLDMLPMVKAVLWLGTAIFLAAFLNWTLTEMAIRHLPPTSSQSFFPIMIIGTDMGVLITLLVLRGYLLSADPNHVILVVVGFLALFTGLVLLQFFPSKNIEIRFKRSFEDAPVISSSVMRRALVFFSIVTICLGFFKVAESYLVTLALKHLVGSYASMAGLMTNYYLIGTPIVMVLGLVTGWYVQRKHVSPMTLLVTYIVSMIVVTLICLKYPVVWAIVGFEIARRVGEHCLYIPASQVVLSAFVEQIRKTFMSLHNLLYFTIPGVGSVALFWLIGEMMGPSEQIMFTLVFILVALMGAMTVGRAIAKNLATLMIAFLESGHKSAVVKAIQFLSFLKPQGALEKLKGVLSGKTKMIVRNMTIHSLGYFNDKSSQRVIMEEFQRSRKESTQLFSLDALSLNPNDYALEFLLNVASARMPSASIRVRLKAVNVFSHACGQAAVPFLESELYASDPRMVANTLEALFPFRSSKLASHYEKLLQSESNRVRATALVNLAHLGDVKNEHRQRISNILYGRERDMMPSILYVIGKLRDRFFLDDLLILYDTSLRDDPALQPVLAWALVRLGQTEGNVLFKGLFDAQERDRSRLFHFFSQLDEHHRLGVLQYVIAEHLDDPAYLQNMIHLLKASTFDFHKEVDFVSETLTVSLKKQKRKRAG